MGDNINPTTKTAQVVVDSPFQCPHCQKPANQIEATPIGPLIVFWHQQCKAILGLQLTTIPQAMQPKVVVPAGGRIS